MANKSIPQSAGTSILNLSKRPTAFSYDYSQTYPCWRIGHFDFSGKWGINNLGKFRFVYTAEMLEIVATKDDNNLSSTLDKLNNKQFASIKVFWNDFKREYSQDIPISLVECIEKTFIYNAFVEKIYPKLQTFEENTWDEIRQYSHRKKDKSASNNHFVSIQDLSKEAQERLNELGYSDRSEIYSLRLEGTIRIYGFREMNYMDIIWVDLNHEVYKPHKR